MMLSRPNPRGPCNSLLDKPCKAGCEASESPKTLFFTRQNHFFSQIFQKKCSKSGSRKVNILPSNEFKEGFLKNPRFKLCVLSSTCAHVFSTPTKLAGNPYKQTNIQTNFLAQTTRVLRTITLAVDRS